MYFDYESHGSWTNQNQIHNAHIFYIKVKCLKVRDALIGYLKEKSILAAFHYVPLHSSNAGKKYGKFYGEDNYTSILSQRLLRLPLHYALKKEDVSYVCKKIIEFFK